MYNLRPYIGNLPQVGGYIMPPYINTDGGAPAVTQFVSTWDTELTDSTASATKTIVLPMTAGPEVDWGDGTINNLNSHVYSVGGQYDITIDDTNSDFRFNNLGDKTKIIDVSQCNGLNITNNSVFRGCGNLEWSATDAPDITSTNLDSLFLHCVVMDGDLRAWDVSNVTRMVNMFFNCTDFQGSGLEYWDVGNCANFAQMFYAVHNLAAPIGVWDMSSATNIAGMFRASNGFNEELDDWDVSSVQTMNHVFAGTSSFDRYIGGWDVGSVQTTHAMFSSINYNEDITGWAFGSSIRDLSWMFAGNGTFDQDISGWNVAAATSFNYMFGNASSFNQDLTGLDFGSATNLTTMLDNCGMNTANYDAFLVNMNSQAATINSGLTLGAQGRTYTIGGAGETARTTLGGSPALMSFVGDSGV